MPDPSSREQILDAAERLFAQHGYARTTIKQIGAEAGVNSALIYYYFGGKEALYHEVLGRFVDGLASRTTAAAVARDPAAGLRRFLHAQAEALAANPHFPRLLVRELAESDAAHAVAPMQLLAATSFRRLCELIEEGQRTGVFRRDLDPRYAAISSIAQLAYFYVARPALRILLESGPMGPGPEVTRAFAAHAAEFALAALAAPRGRRPGGTG